MSTLLINFLFVFINLDRTSYIFGCLVHHFSCLRNFDWGFNLTVHSIMVSSSLLSSVGHPFFLKSRPFIFPWGNPYLEHYHNSLSGLL